MKTPFTSEQFLEVFKNYNNAVWPLQIIFFLLGIGAIILLIRNVKYSSRFINAILSFFWLWIGIVYHITFFTTINKAAYVFGSLFIIQGLIFLVMGVIHNLILFQVRKDSYGLAGFLFLGYALIIYPVLGYLLGHVYPSSPTFGLPCPTVIFTFGILMFTVRKVSWFLLVIPALWSIIGFSAAISFGIVEDTGLLISGLTGTAMIIMKNREYKLNKLPG